MRRAAKRKMLYVPLEPLLHINQRGRAIIASPSGRTGTAHLDFIRLVSSENVMNAQYIAKSTAIRALNRGAITLLQSVLDCGRRDKVFRQDVDPVDVHLLISSFCFFRVSNRYTFNALFGRNLSDPAVCVLHKKMLTDAVLNAVMANSATEPRTVGSAAA